MERRECSEYLRRIPSEKISDWVCGLKPLTWQAKDLTKKKSGAKPSLKLKSIKIIGPNSFSHNKTDPLHSSLYSVLRSFSEGG